MWRIKHFYSLLGTALAILLTCLSVPAWAQDRAISGRVVETNSTPIPGATVLVKGTTNGTITDLDGYFKLQVPSGAVLIVSYVGYVSREIPVGTQTVLDIVLKEDAEQLEEVVVIGYGTVKKEDLTGSIQAVTASDFNQGAMTTPQDLIVGKIPGVQVTTAGGAPGSGATIRIRGGSSLTASNDPLIIIDGVPVSNTGIGGVANPLATINPADIETFTVLKDASATAIYGSRASNGVILITTKRGTGGAVRVDYTANVFLSSPYRRVKVLDVQQFRDFMQQKFPSAVPLLGSTDTDWQDQVLKTSVSTDHTVAVAGSIAQVVPYRVSTGFTYQDGILKTSSMKRTTVGVNLNPKFLDNHLKVDASFKYSYTNSRFGNQGAIGSAVNFDPTQVVTSPEERYAPFGGYFTWLNSGGSPNSIAPANPLALLRQRVDEGYVNRFISNVQLSYKLHFFPDITANVNFGMDNTNGTGKNVLSPQAAFDVAAFNNGGAIFRYDNKYRNYVQDYYLQYQKKLEDIESNIDATVGYSWQKFKTTTDNTDFFGNGLERAAPTPTATENFLVSFFGRLNYVYKQRYLLTATLRADGSSRFASGNRWGYFPSVAAAWTISKENFLKDSQVVSQLKLRVGYGETGQQDIGSDYGYLGTFTQSFPTADYLTYNQNPGALNFDTLTTQRPNAFDPQLKWESTTTYNVGIDYGFLDDRITGSLEFYLRDTKDLLNQIPIAAGSNFSNELLTNVGSLRNKGIEFFINANLVQSGGWFWEAGFNLTANRNEITKLTRVNDPNYAGVLTGGISGGTGNRVQIHSVGHAANTFFVYEQVYGQDGRPLEGVYVDQDGDGKLGEGDKIRYKQPRPLVLLGFTTRASYKQWDFSMAMRYQGGNYVYNNIASNGATFNRLQTSGQFTNNLTDDILKTGFNNPQYFSSYYVQRANFWRMDNIQVGYNIPKLGSTSMALRISATINNVFVATPYKGLDPEVFDGIDNNVYPRPRIYQLGLNLSI